MRKLKIILMGFGILVMLSTSCFADDITITPDHRGGFNYYNYRTGESGTIQPDGLGGYTINNSTSSLDRPSNQGRLNIKDIWRIPNENTRSRLQNKQQRLQNKLLELKIRELQKRLEKSQRKEKR